MTETKDIDQSKLLFQDILKSLRENAHFIQLSKDTLSSSYYSLPLMFNVINVLKANKVDKIPTREEVAENQVIEFLADAFPEGKSKNYGDVIQSIQEWRNKNTVSQSNLEKIDKGLENTLKVHKKWARTVDLDKIPPTRNINLEDEKEVELSHDTVLFSSKFFEKSRVK